MSRIHDALKKAAEERASRTPGSPLQVLSDVDLPEEVYRPAVIGARPEAAPTNGKGYSHPQIYLRFEELQKRCPRPEWVLDPQMNVFEGMQNKKLGAEPFRTLRSRLYQLAGARTLKRILITSSVAAEGKTFVAANLAQSIVRQPDRRVLLIDADLRASRLHLALGAPANPGLTDYLRGEADECTIIQRGPQENLCFIPGGSEVSNPSELLLSEKMGRLLDTVTPVFDFVILDSPPATPVHDPSMLADFCDGVLFVVRAGVTNFELAEKAVAEFREKNLLGVVLNGVGEEEVSGQYYYGDSRD